MTPLWIEESLKLNEFYWAAQPQAVDPVSAWLKAWADFRFKVGDRPAPVLFVWGPFGTGKSELAKAITRFMHLNLGARTVEMVYWPEWVNDQLNGSQLHPNWHAHLLLLDDLDKGQRPIPRSLDTWLLGKIAGILKPRAEIHKRPTIITTNRGPRSLLDYFSTNSLGESSEDTQHAALHILSALERHTFAEVQMNPLPKSRLGTVERNRMLKEAARQNNDMTPFLHPVQAGFLEEIAW